MNAVAATTNFGPGILAAFPIPAAPVPATPAPSGFVNLINALLGPQDTAPEQDAMPTSNFTLNTQDSTQQPVPVRTSSEIADAMIRSMLGSPVTATNLFSDQASAAPQTGSTKVRVPKDDPHATADPAASTPVQMVTIPVVPALPLPMTTISTAPIPTPAATPSFVPTSCPQTDPAPAQNNAPSGQGTGSSKSRGNSPVTVSSDLKPTVAKADLAFALKLTPVETPASAPSAATPSKAASALPVAAAPVEAAPVEAAPAVPVVAKSLVIPNVESAPSTQQPPSKAEPPSQDSDRNNQPRPAMAEAKPRQGSSQASDSTPVAATAATSNDHSENFSRPLPNPPPAPVAPHTVEAPQAEPFRSTDQALRAADANAPTPAPKTASAQQIAVRVSGPDSPAVDLHVTQRAGQVLVSVRTPDTGLQSSLRQDLGSLVNSLERSGYKAEAVTPRDAFSLAGNTLTGVAAQSGGASFMDARNHAQSNSQNGGQNSGEHAGQNGRGGSQRQGTSQDKSDHSDSQQQRRGRPQLNWIDTLENAQ